MLAGLHVAVGLDFAQTIVGYIVALSLDGLSHFIGVGGQLSGNGLGKIADINLLMAHIPAFLSR